MKKFLLSILGCLSFMFITQHTKAQVNYLSGYIVTKTNDTIPGKIDVGVWNNTPTTIRFKSDADNKQQKLAPTDIASFFVENKYFISKEVVIDNTTRRKDRLVTINEVSNEKKHLFLQLIFQGTANLYYHQDQKQNNHFFIEKEDVPVVELVYQIVKVQKDGKTMSQEKTKYKGQLLYYFKECPNLQKDIEHLGYVRSSFIKLFKKHEECVGGNIAYTLPKGKAKLRAQVFVGASKTFTSISKNQTFEERNLGSSTKYLVGIGVEYQLKERLKNFSLTSDFYYKSTYSSSTSWQKPWVGFGSIGPQYYNYEGEFSVSYLKWSNMFKCRLYAKNIQPFIGLGISQGWALNPEFTGSVVITMFPDEVYTGELLSEFKKTEQGYLIGAGLSSKKFNLELRYENGNGFFPEGPSGGNSSSQTFMLMLGYWF